MRANLSWKSAATGAVLACAFGAGAAVAAGGDDTTAASKPGMSGAKQTQNPVDETTCDKGYIWDVKTKKCVVKQGAILPDGQLTEYAYVLARAKRYPEALEVLDLLKDPKTPHALNYRGYATRKLGRTDEGIAYYLQAVALDPSYIKVREYLGEAYLIKGQPDLANAQLAEIGRLCGSPECPEYGALSDAIHGGAGW